jgi:F-type H+-transporting ATPase subunit epsilon
VNTFAMELRDAARGQRIENVTSFVGEDGSGSFGLLAHHARFMTVLVFGLARYRIGEDQWHYLALPGGLLYFTDNTLRLSTRRYLLGDDYQTICAELEAQLVNEEQRVRATRENLRHMEEEVLRSLWRMERR